MKIEIKYENRGTGWTNYVKLENTAGEVTEIEQNGVESYSYITDEIEGISQLVNDLMEFIFKNKKE